MKDQEIEVVIQMLAMKTKGLFQIGVSRLLRKSTKRLKNKLWTTKWVFLIMKILYQYIWILFKRNAKRCGILKRKNFIIPSVQLLMTFMLTI